MAWVVELTGYDTSGPGVTVVKYAMGPGVVFWDAAYAASGLVSWKSSNQKVDVTRDGGVQLSADIGQVVIQNLPNDIGSAGPLDALADWAWQSRTANLYWCRDNLWANKQLMDTAVLQQPIANLVSAGDVQSNLTFPLRDPRAVLSVPLQPTKFLGNNSAGAGVEGEADIKGKPKPVVYGIVSNAPGVRVNSSQLIYQVADASVTVLCARDGGLGITAGTARASLASLQSNTPSPGTYDTYAGTEGTFVKLGTRPVFQMAFDLQEGGSRTNLLLQSQTFDNGSWSKTNATVTANAVTAPDGTATADNLLRTATGDHQIFQGVAMAATVGFAFTFSVWIKAGTLTGDVAVTLQSSNGLSLFTTTMTPTSAWQRSSVTGVMGALADTTINVVINPVNNAGSAGDTLSVWGAQLETGFVATPYIATVAAAATGTRTNLFLRSAEIDDGTWVKTNCTITANNIAAPDGATTGDRLNRTAGGAMTISQTYVVGQPIGYTYTFSIWLKGGTAAGTIRIILQDSGATNQATLDVTPSSKFWTRHTITRAFGSTSTANIVVSITTLSAGSAADTFYAWGAQLEEGLVATQYIPTTTVTVAAADMSRRTHAQVWRRFRRERCENLDSDFTSASLATADALESNEVGFYWDDETTRLSAMNEILTSLSGFEVQGFDMKWAVAKLVAPSGTTVLDFLVINPLSNLTSKQRPMRSLTRVRPSFAPDGSPPYRVTVDWGRAYQQFNEADFAGAAPQRLRDKFALEYRSEVVSDTSLWDPVAKTGPWTNAPELKIVTAYQPGSDGLTAPHANAEASRALALYSANKAQYTVEFTPKMTDQIIAGNVCSITYPQMGLSGGKLFVVLQSALTVEKEVPKMALVLGFQT